MPPSTRVYTVEQYSFTCIVESANVTRCRRIRFFRRVSGATIANGDVVGDFHIRRESFSFKCPIHVAARNSGLNFNFSISGLQASKINNQCVRSTFSNRHINIENAIIIAESIPQVVISSHNGCTTGIKHDSTRIGNTFTNANFNAARWKRKAYLGVIICQSTISCLKILNRKECRLDNAAISCHRRHRQHAEYHNQN